MPNRLHLATFTFGVLREYRASRVESRAGPAAACRGRSCQTTCGATSGQKSRRILHISAWSCLLGRYRPKHRACLECRLQLRGGTYQTRRRHVPHRADMPPTVRHLSREISDADRRYLHTVFHACNNLFHVHIYGGICYMERHTYVVASAYVTVSDTCNLQGKTQHGSLLLRA